MEIRLRYFEGCPHWKIAQDRLREALLAEDMADVEPILERVETPQDAERLPVPRLADDPLGWSRPVRWSDCCLRSDVPRLPDTGGSRRVPHPSSFERPCGRPDPVAQRADPATVEDRRR